MFPDHSEIKSNEYRGCVGRLSMGHPSKSIWSLVLKNEFGQFALMWRRTLRLYLDRIVHRIPHAMYFTVILNVCFYSFMLRSGAWKVCW